MQGIITVMQQTFSDIKSGGSYLALLFVALYILYRLNEKKNIWYILYTTLLFVFVCMNPILIFILAKAFPVLGSYRVFMCLLPILLIVPFAVTEMIDRIRDSKQARMVLLLAVIVIGISGNSYGLYQGNVDKNIVLSEEEKEIIHYVEQQQPSLIVADVGVLPFLRTHSDSDIQLLYGRDLYQPNTDLGIMDGYPEEFLSLYEAMKNPGDTIWDILATAELYGCDMVITKAYEKPLKKVGHFQLSYSTENYLVYGMKY